MSKNIRRLFLMFLTVALIAVTVLTGCQNGEKTPPAVTGTEVSDTTEIGQGSTTFPFEVKDDKGNVTKFTVSTDKETVGAALLEAGIIEGSSSEFGLYVEKVNGLKADYNVDKSYWAFYIDGSYAMEGVDTTAVDESKTYAFVYTKD